MAERQDHRHARRRLARRLLLGALLRRRGLVAVAVMAVAIGASVAAALLHLSADVGRKVGRELAAFGPNLLVVPRGDAELSLPSDAVPGARAGQTAATAFLEASDLGPLESEPEAVWAPVLYVLVRSEGRAFRVAGSDLERLRALHPTWRTPQGPGAWAGAALARRMALRAGEPLVVEGAGGRRAELPIAGVLEAGGVEDEMLWAPLAEAEALAGRPGVLSLAQARIPGDPAQVEAFARRFEDSPGARAVVLRALSATEGDLLRRMRKLMAMVTAAALLAAMLSTFGTLSDLALERRREIALMKALGAGRSEVAAIFAAESLAIGSVGGVLGWAIGFGFAQLIGRQVFHSGIGIAPWIPFTVLGVGLLTTLVAGIGPARWALGLEPAPLLKGE